LAIGAAEVSGHGRVAIGAERAAGWPPLRPVVRYQAIATRPNHGTPAPPPSSGEGAGGEDRYASFFAASTICCWIVAGTSSKLEISMVKLPRPCVIERRSVA